MVDMSTTLHPSDGIVISREWLNENLQPDRARYIIKNSQPLKPVLEVALNHGILCGIAVSFFDDMRQTKEIERVKQEFLNNPIEMK